MIYLIVFGKSNNHLQDDVLYNLFSRYTFSFIFGIGRNLQEVLFMY